jgi:capsular exopolysaccharide synthesis family protein
MGDRADSAHIGLRHYVHVLQRRALPAAVVTLIVVAGSLLFSLRTTPVYAASADLLVNPTSPSLFSETGTLSGDRRTDLNTQVELIQSPVIRQAVLDALGPAGRKVGSMSATPVGQTTVVRLTVESTDARLAKRAVDTYASTYIATRQRQQNDTLQSAGAQVQKKLADIERQLGALDAQAPAAGPGAKSDVNAQRLTLQSQYTLYKQKLDQLQIDASLKDAGVQVASTASTPTTPIRPRHLRDALLATFIGLLMGVGVAFVFEYLDDRIRSAEDVTRYGEGLTTLAEIPSVQGWRDRSMTKVVTLETPEAPAAEAYWSLRTSVQLIGIRDPLRSLLVTSSIAGEGKSTTVANLGVAMARTGMRVALVDLDLRNPRLAEFFGFDNRLGLTSVLVGEATLERALHPVRVIDGAPPMMVLGSGVVPKNPSEVLGTARVGELLTLLQSKADIVIIDSPPLVPVTDGLVLANRVDGVLLVVGAGRARRQQVGRAVKLLHQAHALTIGAVLSSVKQRQPGYGYGYGYGYGVAEEAAAVLDPDAPLRGRVQAPQEPPAAFPVPSTGSNGGGRRSGVPGT